MSADRLLVAVGRRAHTDGLGLDRIDLATDERGRIPVGEHYETAIPGVFAIGALGGLALMYSAMGQGSACASAIAVSKNKPEIFGISVAPAAVVEGFAVFVLVFGLVLAGNLAG